MKIVVLDGKALAANDLNYDVFREFGEVTVYENTKNDQVLKRIGDSEIVITNKVLLPKEVLEKCPNLKLVLIMATGYNIIDLDAAKNLGITVCNIPSYSTNAVAQYVFATILNYYNKISEHNLSVQKGDWIKSDTFSYTVAPIWELAGKTLGIVGFGEIGKAVCKIALAFNMKVLVYSRTKYPQYENENLKFTTLNELLKNSDIVTLHCPLTVETQNLIGEQELKLMKNSAMLINSARGPVVNEEALANALKNGEIAFAAVDVLCSEPMSKDCPLYNLPNCTITPHIAWMPFETRKRLMGIAVENLKGYLNGKPQNIVNP